MQDVKQRQQDFNDDGTPRRKYELEDAENGKWGLRSAITFALVTGFALVKNVLYPAALADAGAEKPLAASESERQKADYSPAVDPEEEVLPAGERGASDAASRPAAMKSGIASSRPGAIHTAELPASDNDNSALYGAAPGKPIVLIPSHGRDGAHGGSDELIDLAPEGAGYGGGGGGDGGAAADGDAGGEDNDGPEDDDGGGIDEQDPGDLRNRAPIVSRPVQLGCLGMDQVLVLTLAELLQHASDPDGDTLSITGLSASSGDIKVSANGSWSFTPRQDGVSDVAFAYFVGDGELTVEQHAYLDIVPADRDHDPGPGNGMAGTEAADLLIGTTSADVIDARGGDDTVVGLGGDDVLFGGRGADRIIAGAGGDVIYGGNGDDVVFAGTGDDAVFGGDGNDVLLGEEGDDVLLGEAGDDTISGGTGDDVVAGGAGSDRLRGDEGRDVVDGGADGDELAGGAGDDILRGGAGMDEVSGDDGDDLFIAEAGDGDDVYDGGLGRDTLDLSATLASAVVDLASGEARSSEIGNDVLTSIEAVEGGAGDDTIAGSAADDVLHGGAGADVLAGRDGDDTLSGGAGNDTLDGGEGEDTLDFSDFDADARIDLEAGLATSADSGTDVLRDIEHAQGGRGDDVIIASVETNLLSGGEGADQFVFRTSASVGMGSLRDRLLDFEIGDRIDLDDISAEFAEAVEETLEDADIRKFVLIGEQQAFQRPGQLKIVYEMVDDREVTLVAGNIDYDANAEFELEIIGRHTFSDSDFHRAAG